MNTVNARLAHRYALAFLDVYGATMQEHDFIALRSAFNFLLNNADIFFFLTLAHISTDEKKRVVMKFINKFKLIPSFERLCMLLIEHRRMGLLKDVLRSLLWEYQERYKKFFFTVASSHTLSPDAQNIVQNFLHAQLKRDVIIEYTIDKSLIAGIKIIGDTFYWEYSIARQLNKIKQAIIA